MPQPFIFQAQDARGKPVADLVAAETLTEAKATLESRGYRDIVFVTDETREIYERAALADAGVTPEDLAAWTPRDHIASLRRRGTRAHLIWAAQQHAGPVAMLAGWNLISFFGDRPFGIGDWAGFVATPLYALYFVKLSLPFMVYQRILEAVVWHDHRDLRRLIRTARALRRIGIGGIPEHELDFREAGALAAEGKLSDALAHVERWRDSTALPPALFLGRLATLHENAGDAAGMIARLDEAAALTTEGVTHWIDCAAARIRLLGDVEGAKAELAKVGDVELAALPCAFRNFVEGVIAVEEGRDAEAVGLLDGAIDDLAAFGNPIADAVINEAKSYLLIAEARLGKHEAAQAHFAEVRALLKITRPNDLYPRCEASAMR